MRVPSTGVGAVGTFQLCVCMRGDDFIFYNHRSDCKMSFESVFLCAPSSRSCFYDRYNNHIELRYLNSYLKNDFFELL